MTKTRLDLLPEEEAVLIHKRNKALTSKAPNSLHPDSKVNFLVVCILSTSLLSENIMKKANNKVLPRKGQKRQVEVLD